MSLNPIRKLPMAAAIYASGDVLVKAASFFLLPLLTRYLSPRDYGILGSVSAFVMVLGLVLQLNLNGALMRFHGEYDESKQQEFVGTLILFSMLWSVLLVSLLNVMGPALFDHLYREVRFEPYLRIGTWIALFNSAAVLPLTLIQIQQRPVLHRLFSVGTFALTTICMVVLVTVFGMGAYGALLGQLIGAALAAAGYVVFVCRHVHVSLSPGLVKVCLAFSIPLLVYALGGWAVDTSNRIFIERILNLEQLGLFNVASQFAMVLGYLLNGVALAFSPLFYETVRLPDGPPILARFGVRYIAATFGVSLVVAVFSREAIAILTQPRFHDSYRVVPILTATQALTSFWHLIVNPLMFKKRTGSLMGVMLISATLSVGLNWLLVPRYGIIGAALSALLGNLALNSIVFILSIRVYPVPYDYSQLILVVALAVGLYFLSTMVVDGAGIMPVVLRGAVVAMYPVVLIACGIVDRSYVGRFLRYS